MMVMVLAEFKIRVRGEEIDLHPGQRVKLKDAIAERLISEGKVQKAKMASVKIFSKLFNEEIWLVADQEEMEALVSKGVKEPIYMAWEILVLKGKDKESLKAVHATKKVFPGSAIV